MALDSIGAAFRQSGTPVYHMFSEPISDRVVLWRVFARRLAQRRTIDSATWEANAGTVEDRVLAFLLITDSIPRVLALTAAHPLMRQRAAAAIDSLLRSRSRRVAGY